MSDHLRSKALCSARTAGFSRASQPRHSPRQPWFMCRCTRGSAISHLNIIQPTRQRAVIGHEPLPHAAAQTPADHAAPLLSHPRAAGDGLPQPRFIHVSDLASRKLFNQQAFLCSPPKLRNHYKAPAAFPYAGAFLSPVARPGLPQVKFTPRRFRFRTTSMHRSKLTHRRGRQRR
jgi:hypothetical protein